MRQLSTGHPDVILIEPQFFRDDRGYFCETYNQQSFAKIGISDKFVQDNESASSYGVVRGLHFQRGIHAQAKLIRVLCGDILDVAVDIRMGSPMFGQVVCCQLSAENHRQIYIPKGFAHGFYVISDIAVVCFKVSDYWYPNDEIGISWNDPELKINWPIKENEMPIIADKDLHYDPFSLLKEKLHQREE